ncbi:7TM GPCR protein, partial [Aphelenchoides avenae]
MQPCLGVEFRTSEYIASSLSLLANFALILLILLKSTRELHVYSRLLLCNAAIELLFTASSFIVELHVDYRSGIVFVIANGIETQSVESRIYLSGAHAYFLYLIVLSVIIPQLYRYYSLCRNQELRIHQTVLLLLFVTVGAGAVPATAVLCYMPSALRISAEDKELIEAMPCRDAGQAPIFRADEALTLNAALPVLVSYVVVTAAYAIIVFCSYRIWKVVKNAPNISPKTRALQRQLNYLLLVQAATPLVLVVAPMGLTFTVLLSGSQWFGSLLPWTLSFLSW